MHVEKRGEFYAIVGNDGTVRMTVRTQEDAEQILLGIEALQKLRAAQAMLSAEPSEPA